MPRPESEGLTPGEHRIMKLFWQRDERSVREIVDTLADQHAVAYTTVATMLKILVNKGYLELIEGLKPLRYRVRLTRAEARRRAFHQLVSRYFAESPQAFAAFLTGDETLDQLQREELEALVARQASDEDAS